MPEGGAPKSGPLQLRELLGWLTGPLSHSSPQTWGAGWGMLGAVRVSICCWSHWKKSSGEAHGSQVPGQQGWGRAGRCPTLTPVLVWLLPGKDEREIAHGLDTRGQQNRGRDDGGRGSQDPLGQRIQWRG